MAASVTAPTYRPDIYARSALLDSLPHFRAIRDAKGRIVVDMAA